MHFLSPRLGFLPPSSFLQHGFCRSRHSHPASDQATATGSSQYRCIMWLNAGSNAGGDGAASGAVLLVRLLRSGVRRFEHVLSSAVQMRCYTASWWLPTSCRFVVVVAAWCG